jgi:hypothetical protein
MNPRYLQANNGEGVRADRRRRGSVGPAASSDGDPSAARRRGVSSLGWGFRPGEFVVFGAERGDTYPVTVALPVGVCDAESAASAGFVGVGCGALVAGAVGDCAISWQEISAVADPGHYDRPIRVLNAERATVATPAVVSRSSPLCVASV